MDQSNQTKIIRGDQSEGKAFSRSLYRINVRHGYLVGIEKTFESNCQRANENFTD
jgi:hypothetical protein